MDNHLPPGFVDPESVRGQRMAAERAEAAREQRMYENGIDGCLLAVFANILAVPIIDAVIVATVSEHISNHIGAGILDVIAIMGVHYLVTRATKTLAFLSDELY